MVNSNKMSFTCNSCTKNFKYKCTLEKHFNCCKGKPPVTPFKCEYCLKSYTRNSSLKVHKETCNSKENEIKLYELKLKLQEKEIELLKEKIKCNNKTTNNTTNNNITNNNNTINNFYGMEPLDLSQKRFDSIVEDNYTYENYIKLKLIPEVILKFLSNDQDKLVALLTDFNRMKIKCLNENLEVEIHDPESLVNFCRKSKPMNSKVVEYIDKAYDTGKKDEADRENIIRTEPGVMASSLKPHRTKFLQKKKKNNELIQA
jgi:hypothetical protein